MLNRVAPVASAKMANMGVVCAVLIVMLDSGCGGVTALAGLYVFLEAGYFFAGR